MSLAGRFCPADYHYSACSWSREADIRTETLYVVGGLYGNAPALDAVEALAAAEERAIIMFNGDFHWCDATPRYFEAINRRVFWHRPLRGNVETELARATDIGAGCGCAYPESVDDTTVAWSNRILDRLRGCVDAVSGTRKCLATLPMALVVSVGDLRIGVVHGDAESLAGWRFAHDALEAPATRTWLRDVRAASRIDVFASSHTCRPVLRDFSLDSCRITVINNGAAGMPNFHGTTCGVLTRIGVQPSPHPTLYGIARDGVFINALPLRYDHRRWLREFVEVWPPGSPAYESYFQRIVDGPAFSLNEAIARPGLARVACGEPML